MGTSILAVGEMIIWSGTGDWPSLEVASGVESGCTGSGVSPLDLTGTPDAFMLEMASLDGEAVVGLPPKLRWDTSIIMLIWGNNNDLPVRFEPPQLTHG